MNTVPFLGISIWLIAKIFVLIALFLYILFALVVIRQVKLMTETLRVGLEFPLKTASYLHLVFAIIVFCLALIIL